MLCLKVGFVQISEILCQNARNKRGILRDFLLIFMQAAQAIREIAQKPVA